MTTICIIPCSGQNHHEGRNSHLIGIDFSCHGFQAGGTFFYKSVAAELDFNETVFPVSQVNNRIAFLTVFVSVMIDFAVKRICKDSEVSDAKGFEKEAECFQVVNKIVRSYTSGCSRDRRVHIVAGVRRAYGSL